jgi:hypothetical protein
VDKVQFSNVAETQIQLLHVPLMEF